MEGQGSSLPVATDRLLILSNAQTRDVQGRALPLH
jgi:hypothetical protein